MGILFDAESKTKRYQISILINATNQKYSQNCQTSYIAFNINSALHNIIDGKTYIVRENFERSAKPIPSELVRDLMQDIKGPGTMATLEVSTKFNAKYRIDANLSINISEDLIGELDKTLSPLVTGKSVRKELELICNEEATNLRDSACQKHVWYIKSNENSKENSSFSKHKKVNFFCNDDTAITLVVICEVVITNHSSLSGLNLHSHKDGKSKEELEKAIQGCKDIGKLLNETLLLNNDICALGDISDIELVAGEKRFKVHKMILAISSKVLAKSFLSSQGNSSRDMKKSNKTIVIDKFDAQTVEKMVQFIYKGYLDKESYKSIRLLTLANKYDIIKLKLHCQAALIDTLDVETAIPLWQAAKFNGANFLQEASEEFMYDYWDKGFQNTSGFRNLNAKDGMELLSSIIAIAKGIKEKIEP